MRLRQIVYSSNIKRIYTDDVRVHFLAYLYEKYSTAKCVVLFTNIELIKTGLYEASLMTIIRCGPTRTGNSDR